MNGLSSEGRVSISPTYPDTTSPFPKPSIIFRARGNIEFKAMVTPITSGITRRYAGRIDDANSRAERYTEKRTTALRAVGTGISAVGTNLYQVD
jgi:hypothetical protein